MRKLFKKALACCLVAAMALTCFVGALTVNAENAAGTIVAANVEVASDATSVVVPVTINADAALNAAKITVAAEGYTVSDIAVASGAAYIDEEDVNGGTFLIQANDNVAGFAAAVVNVTFAADAAVAADVVITLDEVHAATWDEAVVDLAITNGAIAVKAAGPVADDTLKAAVYNKQILIDSTIGFYYTLMIDKSAHDFDDIKLVFSKPEMDPLTYTFTGEAIEGEAEIDDTYAAYGMYYAKYTGVGMYEMMFDITPTLYLYKDGVATKYCTLDATSIAVLGQALYDSDASKRSIITDLFNMGSLAQEFFGEGGNDLTDLAYPNASVDQSYATPYEELTATTEGTRDTFVSNTQLLLGSAPSFWYTIYVPGYTTPTDLTFKASYTCKFDGSVITREVNGAELDATEGAYSAYGMYYFAFDMVRLYDSNKMVTLELTAGDGTSWTYQYSLEDVLANVIDDSTTLKNTLYKAVASFGVSARNFFGPEY